MTALVIALVSAQTVILEGQLTRSLIYKLILILTPLTPLILTYLESRELANWKAESGTMVQFEGQYYGEIQLNQYSAQNDNSAIHELALGLEDV